MRNEIISGRRDVLGAALGLLGGAMVAGPAVGQVRPTKKDDVDPIFAAHARDWAWLVGSWSVRHRKLRERLTGSRDWDEFDGTCVNWSLMGGRGNVDDNVLDQPSGLYRGVGVRTFDAKTRQWSIWWIDSRTYGIEPPVRGGFADGVGTFVGDDTLRGKPVKVRFRWSHITPRSAQWDQAFSPDGGTTWEENWHMDFTRTV